MVEESEKLQRELRLVEALLQTEANLLQELQEKRRLIVDGVSELVAPSALWEDYLEEVDAAIAIAERRVESLAELRDRAEAQLARRQ